MKTKEARRGGSRRVYIPASFVFRYVPRAVSVVLMWLLNQVMSRLLLRIITSGVGPSFSSFFLTTENSFLNHACFVLWKGYLG